MSNAKPTFFYCPVVQISTNNIEKSDPQNICSYTFCSARFTEQGAFDIFNNKVKKAKIVKARDKLNDALYC